MATIISEQTREDPYLEENKPNQTKKPRSNYHIYHIYLLYIANKKIFIKYK